MVRLLIAACLALLPGGASASAQSADTLRCAVGVLDASEKGGGMHALGGLGLGEFDAAAGGGAITSRAFHLRGAGLYLHASVSPGGPAPSTGGAEPLSLSLHVSRSAQLNVRSVEPRQVLHAA